MDVTAITVPVEASPSRLHGRTGVRAAPDAVIDEIARRSRKQSELQW
jgi:hypothetical protein